MLAKKRVLVVDDHALFRAGVTTLLADAANLEVAGEASSGVDALAKIKNQHWDVVVLDISMPQMNGVDTLKQIQHVKPDLPVLILSMHPEDQYAINLIRAGAAGYLSKDTVPEQLVSALQVLLAGRKYISPALAEIFALELHGDKGALHTQLSEREFQIFCKLARGQAVSQIADELCLSVKTISTYRTRILEKMNFKTNADMTYYAIKSGLIQ